LSLSALKLRAYVRLCYGGNSSDADVDGNVDTNFPELRSVVAYLRKENEIADLQLELSKQVNVRLKAQIERLRLQATRTTLLR
jgi:nucleoprotein TPR